MKDQLKAKIAKLKKVVNGGLITNPSILSDTKVEIARLEAELVEEEARNTIAEAEAAAQQAEEAAKKAEEEEAQMAEAAKQAEDEAKKAEEAAKQESDNDEKIEEEKQEKRKKPKVTAENRPAATQNCNEVIEAVEKLLQQYKNGGKRPQKSTTKNPAKKRASEVVADGITGVVARVVKLELTQEKVGKIKVAKLRDARDKAVELCKALRQALGGISSDNDGFIEDLKNQFNAIIEQVEAKQKVATEKEVA